jgi:hypothetical protein
MNIILLESGSELPKDPALLLKMVSYLNQAISGKIAKMALFCPCMRFKFFQAK